MILMDMRDKLLIVIITFILFIESVIVFRSQVSLLWFIIILFVYLEIIKELVIKGSYKKLYKGIENDYRKYEMALEASKGSVWEWDDKSKKLYISNRINKVLNIKKEINSFQQICKYIDIPERKRFIEFYYNLYKNKDLNEFTIEHSITTVDGHKVILSSQGRGFIKENVYYLSGIITDITDKKAKESEINFMSYHDIVTGMPNRRYFINEMNNVIENKKINHGKIAIIFIDLDNFKNINDSYGHDIGDILLIKFCNILCNVFNKDSFISRFGGDEFVVAQYGIKKEEDIEKKLENLFEALKSNIQIEEREIYCTVSIGVSIYKKDGKDIETLLKRADIAMYRAKSDGKNKYQFCNEYILESVNKEYKIQKALRTAIENNEIYLVYQPKFNLRNERVYGYECLARWNSNVLGDISPLEFIPVAENSGVIIELEKYIIDIAFRKCKELSLMTDKIFKMSINLSNIQIRDEKIVNYIRNKLKEYDLNPSYIEFEIKESVIINSSKRNLEILRKLKILGVSIALDDFGTGYSSLSYLRILPIDVLNIDKSFIDAIKKDKKSNYIIESIIELSHNLELRVVAEGVETEAQIEYLKEIGCDIIQGFYYNKPEKFDVASKMLLIE